MLSGSRQSENDCGQIPNGMQQNGCQDTAPVTVIAPGGKDRTRDHKADESQGFHIR